MDVETNDTQPAATLAPPESVRRANRAWHRLWVGIRSITPGSLMRSILTIGAIVGIGWVISQTWVALIPFIIGGVIAYAVLPLVNWLDRFLPRFIGVILVMGLVLAVVISFFALLVPILFEQFYRVYQTLPGLEEIRDYIDSAKQYVATLPPSTQTMANNIVSEVTTQAQENANVYLTGLITFAINATLGLVNTGGFILGFLVIPTWLLSVLTEHQHGKRAVDRLLPSWMRKDFWAIVRIFDRAFGTFIRGQMLIAFLVAVLIYGGLMGLVWAFGLPGGSRYGVLLAMIAGLTQLIPSVGPFLGAIPAVLIGLQVSPQFSLMVVVVYVAVQQIVNTFVYPQVERSVVNVHPAILILIVVALSQLGFWWVLVAAPVTAVIRDLYRYIYGRFGDPSRPAGILPDEPIPQPQPARSMTTTVAATAKRQQRLFLSRRNVRGIGRPGQSRG